MLYVYFERFYFLHDFLMFKVLTIHTHHESVSYVKHMQATMLAPGRQPKCGDATSALEAVEPSYISL